MVEGHHEVVRSHRQVADSLSKLKPASVSLAEHKGKELQAFKDKALAELETELVELAELTHQAELACLAELSSPWNARPELPSPSNTRAAMDLVPRPPLDNAPGWQWLVWAGAAGRWGTTPRPAATHNAVEPCHKAE